MANRFWNFVLTFTPGTLAKAEDVNTNFEGVNTGLDDVADELSQSIQVVTAPGTTFISENAAARANKILQFNSAGGIELGTVIGDYKGDHADAAGTDYFVRDVVKDAAAALGLNNIYICSTSHTSTGDLLTDTANWDLLVDVTDAVTAQIAAETAQTAAEVAQAAAEAVYDDFDDRYLGAKASAPALDNDGDALVTGALYFNLTVDKMYVRSSGAAWVLATANADDVNIADAGGYYTGVEVEAALQENGADLIEVAKPIKQVSYVVASASPTTIASAIPSSAKRITIQFIDVYYSDILTGLYLQMGYGATPTWITTGYLNSNSFSIVTSSIEFGWSTLATPAPTINGVLTLEKYDDTLAGGLWTASWSSGRYSSTTDLLHGTARLIGVSLQELSLRIGVSGAGSLTGGVFKVTYELG